MRVEIRPFRLGDETGIATVHRRAIAEINARDYPADVILGWAARVNPERYVDNVQQNGARFWVAETDAVIVGFSSWHNDLIGGLFVLPEYLGQGLGRTLLQLAEEDFWQATQEPYCRAVSTLTARTFYERHGFVCLEADVQRFRNGTEVAVWQMRKERP